MIQQVETEPSRPAFLPVVFLFIGNKFAPSASEWSFATSCETGFRRSDLAFESCSVAFGNGRAIFPVTRVWSVGMEFEVGKTPNKQRPANENHHEPDLSQVSNA
jgi:hypothetical protein